MDTRAEDLEAVAAAKAAAASPRGRLLRRRFGIYALAYLLSFAFCIAFGGFVAWRFTLATQPPDFVALSQYIGQPGVGEFSPEVLESLEKDFGQPPVADPLTGDVPAVRAAFRTGNLPPGSLHFTAWGRPVPFVHEGRNYWAVPFRYEADMGFGSMRQDTATALIQDGYVTRFLFVPFWQFMAPR